MGGIKFGAKGLVKVKNLGDGDLTCVAPALTLQLTASPAEEL